MEITQTNQNFGIGSTPSPQETNPSATISSDFETFLLMLTAQLEHQDPMNPVENSDYAVQLATFSQVEQQVLTNELLGDLAQQLNLSGMAQLAGWVGMEARSSAPVLFDGAAVTLFPEPATSAEEAVLVVRDAGGNVVERLPIAVSDEPLSWAGVDQFGQQRDAGLYSFTLESYARDELIATSDVEAYAQITEAQNQAGETILILQGGVELPANAVTALRDPA